MADKISNELRTSLDSVKDDIASIEATGSTNTTGSTITNGTYFYLNGTLVKAIADIASGATFTSGTNYETITAGGLNSLYENFGKQKTYTITPVSGIFGTGPNDFNVNVRSVGKVFVIDGAFYVSTQQSANTTIANIANFSSQFQLHTPVIGTDRSKMTRLALSTSGELSCEDTLTNGTWYSWQMTGLLN